MQVLIIASECAPLVKVGGLGDVIGSLPKALRYLGINVSVAIPLYQHLLKNFSEPFVKFSINFGGKKEEVFVVKGILPHSEVPLLLFGNHFYISSGGVYLDPSAFASSQQEIERFAFFSSAVVQFLKNQTEEVDVIHLNDWHTGLIPNLLRKENISLSSIFTIHNLANQGFSNLSLMEKLSFSKKGDRLLSWDAQDDNLDCILQGIIGADVISTVSPTYAQEILTPEFGEGIEEVLKSREGRIFGILNGIDTEIWNPRKDPFIFSHYDSTSWKRGKKNNKIFLQKRLNLRPDLENPLLGMISRLTSQKGVDLLCHVIPKIMEKNIQLVILGKGDKKLEEKLQIREKEFSKSGNISVKIEFDEQLAHQIFAASDFILMPSRFEPCGLPQMIGMRYGVLPIVRKTGGLADSVKDGVTGFSFVSYTDQALWQTMEQAVSIFMEKKQQYQEMVDNALKQDFSWKRSAREYMKLYQKAIEVHEEEKF